jgi:hypothetical protein
MKSLDPLLDHPVNRYATQTPAHIMQLVAAERTEAANDSAAQGNRPEHEPRHDGRWRIVPASPQLHLDITIPSRLSVAYTLTMISS